MHTHTHIDPYNGHPSWNHWNCSLWAFNDAATYHAISDRAEWAIIQPDDLTGEEAEDAAICELAAFLADVLPDATPDGAEWTNETREYVAREFIIEMQE